MRRILLWCFTGLVLAALGFLLIYSGAELFPWSLLGSKPETVSEDVAGSDLSGRLREHFFLHAVEETGAINLVSAIYLGYRAFDTLGETIVLVLSVAGVILLTGVRQ
jgi:hypothetical protein